jgi:hypothetical protein
MLFLLLADGRQKTANKKQVPHRRFAAIRNDIMFFGKLW